MSSLLLKSRTPGSSHKKHRYISRTQGSKGWEYEYDPLDEEDEADEGENADEDSTPAKRAGVRSEDASGEGEGFEKPATNNPPGGPKKPLNLKLDVGKSILRDAQPEDLENDSIVLWRAVDLPSLDTMRQQGKFIGEEPDGGTTLSGTRVGALALGEDGKSPHEDALVAVNVKVDSLQPIPPADTVEETLFPDNPALSAVHVIGHLPGNAVVGVVQEGDALWPSEEPEEAGQAPDMDGDSDEDDAEIASQQPVIKALKRVYLFRRSRR